MVPRGLPKVFVFRDENSRRKEKFYTGNKLRYIWHEARKKAGVPYIQMYNASRHSFGSQKIEEGVDINIIQMFMGHRSPKTTERYARGNRIKQMWEALTK